MLAFLQALVKNYGDPKFVATVGFGAVCPIVFHAMGISDNVMISAIALAGAFAASHAYANS